MLRSESLTDVTIIRNDAVPAAGRCLFLGQPEADFPARSFAAESTDTALEEAFLGAVATLWRGRAHGAFFPRLWPRETA